MHSLAGDMRRMRLGLQEWSVAPPPGQCCQGEEKAAIMIMGQELNDSSNKLKRHQLMSSLSLLIPPSKLPNIAFVPYNCTVYTVCISKNCISIEFPITLKASLF